MLGTANFDVKVSGCEGPPYKPMWAVHYGRVSTKYLMDYGASFPKEVLFSEEQSIASKTKGPPCITWFPDICWGQGLRYRVSNQFSLLQGFKWVWGVDIMLLL
jgi:hypothetical protein